MIFEIALSCGITLLLFLLLKYTFLRWKEQMEQRQPPQEQRDENQQKEQAGQGKDEQP